MSTTVATRRVTAENGPPPPVWSSLGFKMGAAIMLVLLGLSALIFVALSHFQRQHLLNAKEQSARMAEQLFIRSVVVPLVFDDTTAINDTVGLLEREPEVVGVQIWKAAAHGGVGRTLVEQLKPQARAVAAHDVSQLVVDRQPDRIVLWDAVRDPDQKIIAVAAVQFSLASENRAYTTLRSRILMAAAAVACVLALLLWVITRRSILGPLEQLLAAIRHVEAGDASSVLLRSSSDEIGRLRSAFARMATAVARREQDIARRNQDMKLVLDNVGQAFLIIDRQGHIAAERSAIVDRWFGTPGADETIGQYVARIDARAAGLWLLAVDALSDGFTPLEVVLAQLPERLSYRERFYECRANPVMEGEELRQLVLVISDVTGEVERKRAETAQRDVIAAVSKLMRDRVGFTNFVAEAGALVGAIVSDGLRSDRVAFLRDVHTLKGLSGVFGIVSVAEACHRLEDHAAESEELPPLAARQELEQQWRELVDDVSMLGGGERSGLELSAREHAELLSALECQLPHAELRAMAQSWFDEPVLPQLQILADHAVDLGRRLGKCAFQVDFADTHLRLPREPWSGLWPPLVHLVRNAVDHGLETTAERVAAGKPERARLTLSASSDQQQVVIVVGDDGRGVTWPRLAEKARARGLPWQTREDLVAALFTDGISSRDQVSTTSGRGIGMAAVRQQVGNMGGTISVETVDGQGTRMVIRIPLRAGQAGLSTAA